MKDLIQRYGATAEMRKMIRQNGDKLFAIARKIKSLMTIDLDVAIQRIRAGR